MSHRTAMGRTIDMSALATKNEKVRAVGNMNVNARGDVVDSHNKVIKDNTKRVKKAYEQTVGMRQRAAQTPATKKEEKLTADVEKIALELTEEEKQFEVDDLEFVKEEPKKNGNKTSV